MQIYLKISFLFLTAILFVACEGGTTYSKSVINNSQESITLRVFPSNQDAITIQPDETKIIWLTDFQGRFPGNDYSCISELDSVQISISNDKTLSLNFLNNDNWTRESKGGRNSREDCTITISDDHIE